MNKLLVLFVGIIACCFCLIVTKSSASPTIKVTARVIDERGKPIQGADVKVWYMLPNKSGIGTNDKSDAGKTDSEGLFTSTSTSFMSQTTIEAKSLGYYESGEIVKFNSRSLLLNRWEPWNPTIEVVLKKIRNPVAMCRKYLEALPVPKLNGPVGYDMEKGDWVAPHGNGMTSDLVFNCTNNYVSFSEANTNCDISFSNVQDGLQEYKFDDKNQSIYKWPFEAPENGYVIKKLNKWMSVKPEEQYKSNYQEKVNYIFRVRTVVDKNGNVVKANYGKMEGDFRVYKKAEVNFSYIFNPDTSRNLEEDPKNNLLK